VFQADESGLPGKHDQRSFVSDERKVHGLEWQHDPRLGVRTNSTRRHTGQSITGQVNCSRRDDVTEPARRDGAANAAS